MTHQKDTNPFLSTKKEIENLTGDPQERNRMWWEKMPMTYADWEAGAEERIPKTREDFLRMEEILLRHSTFLREEFDFTKLKGLKVVDIGCGGGVLSCYMAKQGANVTSIDLTETATTLTKANAQVQGVALDIHQMDAEKMTFADGAFDFVFSWGVLHHSNNTEQAVKEVGRILKPGGQGMMMVYHKSSLVYYLRGAVWILKSGMKSLEASQDACTDGYFHRHFTAGELSRVLKDAGLTPTNVFAVQQEEKILPFIPLGLDRWLKRRWGWYLVAEFRR